MPHEGHDDWVMLAPDQLAFAVDRAGAVLLRFDWPGHESGLAPGTHLALRLTPEEARSLAEALRRKAAEAEAGGGA